MRNKNNKHLGLEIDPVLHGKLRYIAKYEDRSINGQLLYLIRQCIGILKRRTERSIWKDKGVYHYNSIYALRGVEHG